MNRSDDHLEQPAGAASFGPEGEAASTPEPEGSAAMTVAGGILSSRVLGFLREMATAYFFGVGAHADVLRTALRMPNVLQNLLGEGTISAAFIPIYSDMLEEGRGEAAGRFAGAILGLLLAVLSTIVLLGILGAPYIVALLAPGFIADAGGDLPPGVAQVVELLGKVGAAEPSAVDRYALTVGAVKLIFPMTGVLVLFAWALGVLNSHRRFFLSYFAPVLWNVAILAALFGAAFVWLDDPLGIESLATISNDMLTRLLFAVFVGALVGGGVQFLVPLPLAFKLMRGFRLSLSLDVPGVREALRAFGPVVAGRGVYQLSTYLDLFLASLLATGAVSALGFAQMLYVLPVSLFGMSIAASELPELSRIDPGKAEAFLQRIGRSLRQMLFMVVPTVLGYLVLGYLIVGGLLQRGAFGPNNTWLVYFVLVAYSLGLAATTVSRLLQNAFYALGDTKTPAKIAVWRVVVSTIVAVPTMFVLDRFAVSEVVAVQVEASPVYLGAVGLAVGASVGAWVELWRLKVSLQGSLTAFRLPWSQALRRGGLALGALVPAVGAWWLLPAAWPSLVLTVLVVGVYGGVYLGAAHLLGTPELEAWTGRLLGRPR